MPHKIYSRPQLTASRSELIIAPRPLDMGGWSFGSRSVVWRIWPAVVFYVAFSAFIVSLSLKTVVRLAIPPVLLTVLGVLIGFVISYRAMTGYDRYWMGRSSWSDVIRDTRAMGRIIWFHIPPYLTPDHSGGKAEMVRAMKEKRMALDLVEGFAQALKHHLRDELGLHYDDMYRLIEPLKDRRHVIKSAHTPQAIHIRRKHDTQTGESQVSLSVPDTPASLPIADDQATPPASAYGTFHADSSSLSVKSASKQTHSHSHKSKQKRPEHSPAPSVKSDDIHFHDDEHTHLLRPSDLRDNPSLFGRISADLVPFMSFFSWIFGSHKKEETLSTLPTTDEVFVKWNPSAEGVIGKRRPRIVGGGDNVPLDVLRVLSDWVSVLESRGTVPGGALGSLSGCIHSCEESLTSLEKVLTTPLPFGYSAHIRHTVWIYLFSLPFQLVEEFKWHTIGGVGIAAFIYLGFLAAGEEIEQPFGHDANDLDLDLFTAIIHNDVSDLKKTPCFNTYHSHRSEKASRSIPDTIDAMENEKRKIAEMDGWGEDGDGVGLGIGDDVFGIHDS